MNGWKFVEDERLVVGETLPEGCALVPAERFPKVGTVVLVGGWESGVLWRIVDCYGRGKSTIENEKGERQEWYTNSLYRVVEPVPAAPQKLGRLPKVGEKFWVKVECIALDRDYPFSVQIRTSDALGSVAWLHESLLGCNRSGAVVRSAGSTRRS